MFISFLLTNTYIHNQLFAIETLQSENLNIVGKGYKKFRVLIPFIELLLSLSIYDTGRFCKDRQTQKHISTPPHGNL